METKLVELGVVILPTKGQDIGIVFGSEVPADVSSVRLSQEDCQMFNDLTSCFPIEHVTTENGIVGQIQNPIVFDTKLKDRLLAFVEKYKHKSPKMLGLPSRINQIPLNSLAVIYDARYRHNQQFVFEMRNRLNKLTGAPYLGKDFFDFLGIYEADCVGFKPHTFIGHRNKNERICRWCGMKPPTAEFKKNAHAISESLGNKNVFLCDECDNCNTYFGKTIEQQAQTFFQFCNTLFGIKKKHGGIPVITDKKGNLLCNDGHGHLTIKVVSEATLDTPDGLRFSFPSPKDLIAQDVYRSLCKYAMSVLPIETFSRYEWLVPWLKGRTNFPRVPFVLMYRFPNVEIDTGKPSQQPILQTYCRKNAGFDGPSLICELRHTIHSYLFIVPESETEMQKYLDGKVLMSAFRKLPFYNEESCEQLFDFSSTELKPFKCNFSFTQQGHTEV